MSTASLWLALAGLTLTLPLSLEAAAEPPPPSMLAAVATLEGRPVTTSMPQKGMVKMVEPQMTLAESPEHGEVKIGRWPTLSYVPAAGYFGADRFVVLVVDAAGAAPAYQVDVAVNVMPRRLPLVGRWGSEELGPGVYDTQKQRFGLCQPPPADGQLKCSRIQVEGLPPGTIAMPLVLPGTSPSEDQVALFDPEAGVLYHLSHRGPDVFVAKPVANHRGAVGRVPLVGDWQVAGEPALALVDPNGGVVTLEGKNTLKPWIAARGFVPAAHLPFAWPQEGRDVVSVLAPGSAERTWRDRDGATGSTDCSKLHLDLRRPFRWPGGLAGLPGLAEGETFLLVQGERGLEIYPYQCEGGRPQTIPVKFPDDPPGGGGYP